MTGQPAGYSPKKPTKHTGPGVDLANIVTRNRAPTSADYRQPETGRVYPFSSFWLVGKNPTTGTQGDLWYLSKIVANVATWIMVSGGGSGPLLSVAVPHGTSPVSPMALGLLTFTSTGNTVTITGSTNTINFDIGGGTVAVEHLTGDTGGQLNPTANNFNIRGQSTPNTSGIQVNGTASTLNVEMFSPYALGLFEFTGGDLAVLRASAGSPVRLDVNNTSNTASSDAWIVVQQGGASGGDAAIGFQETGSTTWWAGLDVSDSGAFVISHGATIGATNVFRSSLSGQISLPTAGFTTDGVLYNTAGGVLASTAAGTSGYYLTSQGAAPPIYTAPIVPNYVTGSFTPALAFGGSSTGITYSTQTGKYTQIGNVVYIYIVLVMTSKGVQTGAAIITGLPVTCGALTVDLAAFMSVITLDASFTAIYGNVTAAGTTISMIEQGSAQVAQGMTDTNFANNSTLTINGYYFT